jgi:hypothetical protein
MDFVNEFFACKWLFMGRDMEFRQDMAQQNGITTQRNGIIAGKSIKTQLGKFSCSSPSRYIPCLGTRVKLLD